MKKKISAILFLTVVAFSVPLHAVNRNGQRVNANIILEGGYEEIIDGATTVTTAGTSVQLSSTDTGIASCTICASRDNTGVIAVGASTVVAGSSATRGITLNKDDCIDIEADNITQIWLDSSVSGEDVNYICRDYN